MTGRRRTLRTLSELDEAGLLTRAGDREGLEKVAAQYAIAVTPDLAPLINRSDPRDPIAAQFIPSVSEAIRGESASDDPIGDEAHSPVPGIVHRYPDRVLLKAVSVCPVYCRFCFRREMVGPGKERNLDPRELDAALAYIHQHQEIWEVILTGGDPLMLSAARARALVQRLGEIDHVRIVRWHTRMPIADPARITEDYVAALTASAQTPYLVVHTNHPRELTGEAAAALGRLAAAGVPLLSQSVLLAGVNDDVDTLAALMRRLVELRVRPYYLHHLDHAPGTDHFRVLLPRAQTLVRELRDRVSGLCQPTFVIDIPGGVSKAVASLPDIASDEGETRIRGRDGHWRPYTD